MTPGACDTATKLPYIHLPEDLSGLRVLDVGAWDGWWSFLCEKRGAMSVTAVDSWQFDTRDRGFNFAREALGSRVQQVRIDVHDLTPSLIGKFDLVICLGALHHFKSPLLALERIHSVCAGKFILETHIDFEEVSRPACAFYVNREAYGDPTTRWGPNVPCVEAWLTRAGFTDVRKVGSAPKTWEGGGHRAAFHALGKG